MKRLKTNIDGGFPLVLDDIRWMQEGMYEALAALGKRMCADGYNAVILTGCEIIENSGYSVSPGWVYIDDYGGYVAKVESQNLQSSLPLALSGNTIRWYVSTDNYDESGNKTFYNGSPQQTYQIVKAHIIEDSDPTFPTLLESIKPVWIDGENGIVKSSLMDGMLRIKGVASDITLSVFDTITACHRPSENMYVPISLIDEEYGKPYPGATLIIGANGNLSVILPTGSSISGDNDVYINTSIPIL